MPAPLYKWGSGSGEAPSYTTPRFLPSAACGRLVTLTACQGTGRCYQPKEKPNSNSPYRCECLPGRQIRVRASPSLPWDKLPFAPDNRPRLGCQAAHRSKDLPSLPSTPRHCFRRAATSRIHLRSGLNLTISIASPCVRK